MRIFIKFFPYLLLSVVHAESAMQPPLIKYDYCSDKGTMCGKYEIEYNVINGQKTESIGGIIESNTDQLLNLDHYYRNKCNEELGLNEFGLRTKDDTVKFGNCLIYKLSHAIENRNKENTSYLEKTKEIFK
ncbi:hypothetical protein [Acinetobacter bereziniae]|uniref:hypothetical protein n=1 Tax=Acinetobacter bereziniae TaxID=106648 RepID=UPI0018FFC5FD|nr:hypothetical protein [Acinetobacter bereziniae]MBJ8474348.1 hypothetical protein [Acinetobacter bereziniae]